MLAADYACLQSVRHIYMPVVTENAPDATAHSADLSRRVSKLITHCLCIHMHQEVRQQWVPEVLQS